LDKPNLFQDSSLAFESFFADELVNLTNLTELKIYRRVTELIDFEFKHFLIAISQTFTGLKTLVLQGLRQIDIDEKTMENFLHSVSKNMSQLLVSLFI